MNVRGSGWRSWATCAGALSALLVLLPGAAAAETRKFQAKSCTECHGAFVQKVAPLKVQHPGIKDGNCESCHLRHGIVPKLLLKQEGNVLCLSCHAKEKIGLDKPNVHSALKTGKCVQCHDPHGSSAPHLLAGEGAGACTACHDRKAFERPVVHAALKTAGCPACHLAHSSSEANLLV